MAYRDIVAELVGVPKMNAALAQTLCNRALTKIYDESVWNFQLAESGWFTPSQVTGGAVTVVLGATTVAGDATAKALWNAIPAPFLITSFQFRLPAYAIYNVIAYNPATGVLTLDRPWMEPAGAGLTYQLYQCYYPAPVQDFRRWLAIRDFTNNANMDFANTKQIDLDRMDPERQVFEDPYCVVPYKTDTRPGSSTLGYQMFELYPQPLAELPYALYFLRRGQKLVLPGDTVPFPLTDEVVLYRAKEQVYQWCIENSARYPELKGPDWKFLMQAAQKMYQDRLKDVRKIDRDLCDNFISKLVRFAGGDDYFYSGITQRANVGQFGG